MERELIVVECTYVSSERFFKDPGLILISQTSCVHWYKLIANLNLGTCSIN